MRRTIAAALLLAATTVVAALPASAGSLRTTALRSRPTSSSPRGTRPAALSAPDRALAPVTENFEVLSHLKLKGRTPDADVFLFDHRSGGRHAYVGSTGFPCTARGVRIIQTERPRAPRVVARAASRPGTSAEDVVVARIGDRDVMAAGIQPCGDEGVGGLALFDVTRPSDPRALSFLRVPAFGVHELDVAVRPDGRALALLAVPFAEAGPIFGEPSAGGDFRIVDITRPRRPIALSDFGLIGDSTLADFSGGEEVDVPFRGLGYGTEHLAHSARATDEGMTAYVSYWDAGVLKFDISDPAAPVLLGRTGYPLEAEGNAHSLVPYDAGGERYIVQNDEDMVPAPTLIATSTATGATEYAGSELFWLQTTLAQSGETTGEVFDAGAGCTTASFDGAQGKLALVDLHDGFLSSGFPPCEMHDQIRLAAAEGAAALVLNWLEPTDPFPFPPEPAFAQEIVDSAPEMPVALIADNDGMADAIRSRPGGGPVQMTLTPQEPSWGYIRIFRESGATDINGDGVPEYEEVGSFSDLPDVVGNAAPPPGEYMVHNTEMNGTRAYSSWYSHGIVALDMTDPAAPVKVGQFRRSSTRREVVFGPEGFPFTWGVAIDPATGHVYASDMRSGLWILKPTGPAAGG